MTEGKFTLDDAENDGLIKKEAGPEMLSVVRRTNPRLCSKFEKVCEESGQDPAMVLGDYLVRALNDEQFAELILNTDVDMEMLETDQIRKDDIEFVKDIAEEFNLVPDDEKHPVEKIIDSRIESMDSSPLEGGLGISDGGGDGSNEEVKQLRREVRELRSELQKERGSDSVEEVEKSVDRRKDVDELFSGSDDGDSSEEVEITGDGEGVDGEVEDGGSDEEEEDNTVEVEMGERTVEVGEVDEEEDDDGGEIDPEDVDVTDSEADIETEEEVEESDDDDDDDDEEVDDSDRIQSYEMNEEEWEEGEEDGEE